MIKSSAAVAGVLLAAAGAASAGEFSLTPAVTNDYDWRGLTQSDEEFAFQLGASYEADNGFYIGAWGSQVDYDTAKPDFEVDAFAGYAWGDSKESFGYDAGLNLYTYPGDKDANYVEAYAGVARGMFSAKAWFAPKYAGDDGDDNGFYLEANIDYPLPKNFSLQGHVGYSFGKGIENSLGTKNYADYSLGVGYSIARIEFSARYVEGSDGVDGRFVALISTKLLSLLNN